MLSSKEYAAIAQDEGEETPRFPPSAVSRFTQGIRSPAAVFRNSALAALTIIGLASALLFCAGSHSPRLRQVPASSPVSDAPPRLLRNMTVIETRPPPLTKLGYTADDAYALLLREEYEAKLTAFVREVMPVELHERLLSGLASFPSAIRDVPLALYQTDKEQPQGQWYNSWVDLNPNITMNYFGDAGSLAEVERWFGDGEITQVYKALQPPVLKADMLRYLMLLLRGGVYSDTDTECLKPISDWGQLDKQHAFFNSTSSGGPVANVVVGIEADVDDNGWDFMHHYWEDGLSRPIQFVQWTMLSSPYHPIFLDTIRRIVEQTRKVELWRKKRDIELPYLGESEAAKRLRETPGWKQLHHRFDRAICDWTGPGVFTDSVLSYLGRISDTRWPDFHNTPWTGDPKLIGDVIIGPFITFRPYDEHRKLPQAKAMHFFHNTWQHGHEDEMTHWNRYERYRRQ